MKKSILYILLLVIVGCDAKKGELKLDKVKSYRKNVKHFRPDQFERENIPYPKIDSQLFITHFASIPELKEYADHTSSVFVYSKNKFSNGINGITLMVQDDMFTKKYYLILLDKTNKIKNTCLVAYSTIDTEWYDITETKVSNNYILNTNKVSCEILSQTEKVNYCDCDSSITSMKIKSNGDLITVKEKKYKYKRAYN